MQETEVSSLGGEDPLEEGMTTHSSILVWRIPRTEEAHGLRRKELDMTERLNNSVCVYTQLAHFAVPLKPTQHCVNQLYSNTIRFNKKRTLCMRFPLLKNLEDPSGGFSRPLEHTPLA